MRTDYDSVDQNPDITQSFEMPYIWHIPDPRSSSDGWVPTNGWVPDEEPSQILHATAQAHVMAPAPSPLNPLNPLDLNPLNPLDLDALNPLDALGSHGPPRRQVSRRRPRAGVHFLARNPRIIPVAVLVATITLCAVTMLWWSVSYSYDQLRGIALLVVTERLAHWWPLTVYGPWLLAGLSILRASVQQRSARRSWAVMLLCSATAVALCIGQSPRSLLAMVVVGIPPITALICFRELVGQFSPRGGPRHAADTANGADRTRP